MRLYPVYAVGMLAITDAFVNQALGVLAPDIIASLGGTTGTLTALLAVQLLCVGAAPFLMSAVVRGRPIRAAVSIVTGLIWSAVTVAMAFAPNLWVFGALLLVNGLANGSQIALHNPLLADLYAPAVRGRVLALYGAATPAGAILSPLLVSALTGWLGLDWQAVYVVLGLISLAGCLSALRLRDPGIGRFEPPRAGGGLLRTPTMRRIFAALVVYGMLLVPAATFLATLLKDRWGLGADARGLFSACCSAAAIAVLVTLGRRLDGIFRDDPRRVPYVIAGVLGLSGLAFAFGATAPTLPLTLAGFFVGTLLTPLVVPLVSLLMVAVIAPAQRSYAASMLGVGLAVGGLGGGAILSGAWVVPIPGLVAGLIMATAARTIRNDLIPVREEPQNV